MNNEQDQSVYISPQVMVYNIRVRRSILDVSPNGGVDDGEEGESYGD